MDAEVKDSALVAPVAPALPRRRRGNLRRAIGRAVIWLILLGGAALMVMPFFWMLNTSLKTPENTWLYPPQIIPNPIRWRNYLEAMTTVPFYIYFRNSGIILAGTVLGTVLSSSLVAYALAKLKAPGRETLMIVLLSTMMLPQIVLLIPRFVAFTYLKWIDTFYPLIVPTFFGNPVYIFMLRQFFRGIPIELSDAARMDGASDLTIFTRIILPLSKPAIATVAVFTAMWHWNDFQSALIFLNTPKNFTVALGLAAFQNLYTADWHYLMAASVVVTLPFIILFFFAQDLFVQGVTMTGIKG